MWARVVVGAVLLVAGAAKLADRTPRRVSPLVPWAELVLGALLVVGLGDRWPSVAAAALFAAFTVVVLRRLRAGDTAPCGCFGELSRRPVGVGTVVRNVVLTALAVVGALSR